jgi:hypothetical protein
MRVILCLIYSCAACNKLRNSGPAWIFSENMQMNLIQQNAGGGAGRPRHVYRHLFLDGDRFSILMFLHFFWLPWGRIFGAGQMESNPAGRAGTVADEPSSIS